MTARLRAAAGTGFGVRLLGQAWAKPFHSEAVLLGLPSLRRALVREVLLHSHGIPMILARTVIPPRTLRGAHCGLAHLGDRPLGELLFAHRGLKRSHRELARAVAAGWLPTVAGEFGIESPVWGRRSLYQIGPVSLSVSEFFLPTILSLSET